MGQLKQIQYQNVFHGKVDFAAATEGEILLPKGRWTAGKFAIVVTPRVRQDDSILIVAADETLYTVTIDGREYTYTSDASATTAEIRDGLEAAIDALSPGNGVSAVDIDADELQIIATEAGVWHDVSVGANLTLTKGISAPPSFGYFHDPEAGKIVIRTAAAFTGTFDVAVFG